MGELSLGRPEGIFFGVGGGVAFNFVPTLGAPALPQGRTKVGGGGWLLMVFGTPLDFPNLRQTVH